MVDIKTKLVAKIRDGLSNMTLRFTKHAKQKLNVRQIDPKMVEEALDRPQHRFYDTLRTSEVAARSIRLGTEDVTLVVIYTRNDDSCRIITVYPSKRFKEEVDRKVKSGRWVIIKGSAHEG